MSNTLKIGDDERASRFAVLTNLAIFVLVVLMLRVGKSVLIPIAIAALIAFLLWPLVARFRRWGFGKIPSVVLATGLAIGVITAIGWVMTLQAWEVVRALPRYEQNIDTKVSKLKVPDESGALSQVMEMLGRYEKELTAPAESLGEEGHHPVAVQVEQAPRSTLAAMGSVAAPVLGPLGLAGMAIIFVIAILMQRDEIQDRLLQLVPTERVPAIRAAVDESTTRVYRYLYMQLLVNTGYGIFIGFGLWLIGIPHVLLWGLLSMLLRFVPFLGPWVAAAFPVALAVAIDPGWSKVAYALGLYMLAEIVTANLVEVVMYGVAAGISGLALMFAAVFWTWLWGAPGLLVSTPLTVCLMVFGNHIPALKVFSTLLGREIEHRGRPRDRQHHSRLHRPE